MKNMVKVITLLNQLNDWERIKAMIDFIKDADCTKETPVKLGVPDAPIYGKGIKLKPRVDGRTDSEHFKKIYLPELLPLEEYDLIVVLISGGKVRT